MTAIQYKINARKALAGRAHIGSPNVIFPTPTVSPENRATNYSEPAHAMITFGANAYTCSEGQGAIRLQVMCQRCVWRALETAERKVLCLRRHAYMCCRCFAPCLRLRRKGVSDYGLSTFRVSGHENEEIKVHYATRDGQAIGGQHDLDSCDYEATSGELLFAAGETSKDIFIRVLEEDMVESEEQFYVDLSPVPGYPVEMVDGRATVCFKLQIIRVLWAQELPCRADRLCVHGQEPARTRAVPQPLTCLPIYAGNCGHHGFDRAWHDYVQRNQPKCGSNCRVCAGTGLPQERRRRPSQCPVPY